MGSTELYKLTELKNLKIIKISRKYGIIGVVAQNYRTYHHALWRVHLFGWVYIQIYTQIVRYYLNVRVTTRNTLEGKIRMINLTIYLS